MHLVARFSYRAWDSTVYTCTPPPPKKTLPFAYTVFFTGIKRSRDESLHTRAARESKHLLSISEDHFARELSAASKPL